MANNGTANALWRTDGTSDGTIQLTSNAQAAFSGVSGGSYTDVDSTGLWMLEYNAAGSGSSEKLYYSDGTVAGTYQVTTGLSYAQYVKIYNGALWMASRNAGSVANVEPWRSGGNAATTNKAFEIASGTSGSPLFTPISANPFGYFVKNNKLYFFASSNAAPDRNLYQYTGNFTFNGSVAGGRWRDSANWNGLMPPGITDNVFVNAGTPNALTVDGANAYAGTLVLGNAAAINLVNNNDSLLLSGRLVTSAGNVFAGNGVFALQNRNTDSAVQVSSGFGVNRMAVTGIVSLQSGDVQVFGDVNLVNGSRLLLNAGNITLSGSTSTATITGNSYFVTNGNGRLFIDNIGSAGRAGEVLFPVGSITHYNPASITNAGTTDKFGVRTGAFLSSNYTGETPSGASYSNGTVNNAWFITEATTGGSLVDLKLQWNQAQEQPAFDRSQSYLAHYTGGSWNLGTPGMAAGTNPYSLVRTGITDFSPFAVMNNNAVLPLRFIFFSAKSCGSNNCLNWKTAHEVNVSHFEVERSTDGVLYHMIARLTARNQSQNEYAYADDISSLRDKQQAYYRIRQVDQDGRYSYSPIERIGWQQASIDVYPALINSSLHVNNRTSQPGELLLFSADGRLLQRQKLAPGQNEVALTTSYRGMLLYNVMLHTQVLVQGKLIRF